jgi:inner membrane transporter RhtA
VSRLDRSTRRTILAWGAVLGGMNCAFYLAIARLPLGTVAAIEFVPVIGLAALGSRTRRNLIALAVAVPGIYLLTKVVFVGSPLGVVFAIANATGFAAYIAIGHRVAQAGARTGIDALAAAMLVAAVIVTPIGGAAAL